jgi:hypothetical protein
MSQPIREHLRTLPRIDPRLAQITELDSLLVIGLLFNRVVALSHW